MTGRSSGNRGAEAVDTAAPSFRLASAERSLVAGGRKRALAHGGAGTLAARVAAFFEQLGEGPRCLVGALPFDREQPDCLYQPEWVSFDPARARGGFAPLADAGGGRWMMSPKPTAAAYADAVARCLSIMARSHADADPLRKVVLSRSLTATADRPIDASRLIGLLAADPSITVFATLLPGGTPNAPRMLVGATPELLVSKSGDSVVSHPLAGSSRRSGDPAVDYQSAAALEASDKDRREHQTVVEAVMDTLQPYCRELGAPQGTMLRPTASMWHLGTRIVGVLKDRDTPVAELATALHPTPAVCGLPRDRAARIIAELEGYDRGFYAGAIGWTDAAGDGDWYVSIRSAEIEGARIRLFAGAGIVPGSDPAAEVDETSAKFGALLTALGIDEHGRPLRERAA